MRLGALFRSAGWTGMIAGLFAFLLIGATVARPAAGHDGSGFEAFASVDLAVDHGHHAAERARSHKDGHADHSAADPCKDGCCSSGCFALPGRAAVVAATSDVLSVDLRIAADRLADDGFPDSIDRPPRA
ncbi:MAG: hypothetical protein KGM42_00325 [Hyphomicrobiales bacterium]|nr:hypothetical protein [Hyphomicrobiales bacterium]